MRVASAMGLALAVAIAAVLELYGPHEASALMGEEIWVCDDPVEHPEHGEGHEDDAGWRLFTAPDGQHVSWGEGSCQESHVPVAGDN